MTKDFKNIVNRFVFDYSGEVNYHNSVLSFDLWFLSFDNNFIKLLGRNRIGHHSLSIGGYAV